MTEHGPVFSASFAANDDDVRAAQRLRYDVFIREMGAPGGADVDHDAGLERDAFDAEADHLLIRDETKGRLVGVSRLIRSNTAETSFYSAAEFDLGRLIATGRPLLELGRTCMHKEYRGGTAMYEMWSALSAYVSRHDIGLLFGVASFAGTDTKALAGPLTILHQRHLAPENLRVSARPPHAQSLDMLPPDRLDRKQAMLQMPSLIKAYLRLGGVVGQGAYVDHTFNTTDVCLILDTDNLKDLHKRIYAPRRRG